jgi:lysophospholipid acyltransferase (LPLAT)-like uncharacterized protein
LKSKLQKLRSTILGFVAYAVFWSLRATWKLNEDELPEEIKNRMKNGKPVVFAHLHEDEWAMIGFYANRNMNVMVSLSQDGSIMASFLELLGYKVIRGSSSRRAVGALIALIKEVRSGRNGNVSMAIDGPRGPRRKPKAGFIKLAEALEAPIVVGAAYAKPALVF